MTDKTQLDFFNDIIEAAGQIDSFVAGMTYEQFVGDNKTWFATIRGLAVIGEAAKHIDEECRLRFSTIPWRSMTGMRDVLVHKYDRTNLQNVWDTIKVHLPLALSDLIAARDLILQELAGSSEVV